MEGVRDDYQLIVASEVVPDFRTTQELRGVLELAADCLAPGGRLVFNTFLARPGYVLDDAARELGQQCNSMIFTRDELTGAAAQLPLELVADDSAVGVREGPPARRRLAAHHLVRRLGQRPRRVRRRA